MLSWHQRLVYSSCYELYSALLILLNAIFVGWQTEYAASTVRQPASEDGFEPSFFFAAQILFFLAFATDLVLRWTADGFVDFVSNEVRGVDLAFRSAFGSCGRPLE